MRAVCCGIWSKKWKPLLGIVLLLGLSAGCNSVPIQIKHYEVKQRPDESWVQFETLSVEIFPRSYGRGCTDAIVKPDGEVWVTHQNDATTDWVIGRAVPSLGYWVGVSLNTFRAPFDLLAALFEKDLDKVPAPSDIHGCGGLFDAAASK